MSDDLRQRNRDNAERTSELNAATAENLAERNRIWQEMIDAGISAAEAAEPHGLSAQTVRWNLQHTVSPNARTGDRVGLRRGRKTAAKVAKK